MSAPPAEFSRLSPRDTLVVKFTRRVTPEDLADYAKRVEITYPDRRVILVDGDTEVRIEPRVTRTTNRLLTAAVLALIVDIAVRSLV